MTNYVFLIPEISVFVFVLIYLISFFFERYYSFLYFILLQSIMFLILIYSNSFISFEYTYMFLINSINFIWVVKMLILFLFLFFIAGVYIFYSSKLNQGFRLNENMLFGFFEFTLVCFIFIFSGFLFISSSDFLLSYIFLELQSICLYILASFAFESNRSAESSLKYFFFGAQFSGLFVLGWVLLYSITNLSNFYDFYNFFELMKLLSAESNVVYTTDGNLFLNESHSLFSFFILNNERNLFFYPVSLDLILTLGVFFILLSLISKLGLFPFHFWMIDVYDGSSNLSVFFFSIFPKLVLFVFLLKFSFFFVYLFALGNLSYIFMFLGLGGIVLGTLLNLVQWRIKRFIVVSSIVNLSYLLLFFIGDIFTELMVMGFLLNLVIYVFSIFSLFIVYINMEPSRQVSFVLGDINEFFMQKESNPFIGLVLLISMLSFAGIPPLMGFFGKYVLLFFLAETSYIALFIVLFFSLLGAFYYIRLIRTFFTLHEIKVRVLHKYSPLFSILIFIMLFIQVFFIFFFMFYWNLFINFCLL